MEHNIDDNDNCPCNPIDFFSFGDSTVWVHDYSDEGYIPPPKALVLAIRLVILDAQADKPGDIDKMLGNTQLEFGEDNK